MKRLIPAICLILCCGALFAAKTERERRVEVRRAVDELDAGMRLCRSGEYQQAITRLNTSRLIMDSPLACYYLGVCHAGLEQYREAAEYYQLALDQAADFREAQRELREAQQKLAALASQRAPEQRAPAPERERDTESPVAVESGRDAAGAAPAGEGVEPALARSIEAARERRAAAREREGATDQPAGADRADAPPADSGRESAAAAATAGEIAGAQASVPANTGSTLGSEAGVATQAADRRVAGPDSTPPAGGGGEPLAQAGLDAVPERLTREQDVDYRQAPPPPPPQLSAEELNSVLFPERENLLSSLLEPLLQQNPTPVIINSCEWHHHQALAFEERKLYDRAASELLEALKLEPNHFECNLMLATVLVKMGRAERAAEQFEKTLQRYPDRPPAWYEYGNFQLKQLENHAAAIESFNKALEFDSQLLGAYNNLAITYVRAEMPGKALETLTRGIAAQPNYARFYRNRATIYEKYFQDYGQALGDYRQYIELGGEDQEVVQRYIRELEQLLGGN